MPKKGGKADKKGGKGGKGGKDEAVDVTVLMRKVKAEMARVIADMGIAPELEIDKFLVSRIQEALSTSQTKLVFSGDKPSELGIQVLSQVLKTLTPTITNFKAICFWKMVVGDAGLRDLCQHLLPLAKNEALKYTGFNVLELMDCRVSPLSCTHIAQALRTDISLQILTLDFNAIGDQGVEILGEGLRYNKELQVLNLCFCRIGPAGGAVIGDQIIRESKLKKIRLPGNRIMEGGLEAIALNLGKTSTLAELDVSDNSIGSAGVAISNLCEGLRVNTSLEHVNLEHNVVGVPGALLLMETLPMCPNIKVFKVSGQGIPADMYKEVCLDGKGKKKGKKGKKKK
mmetsp:Transcript_10096/g.23594  ORF Transcript_10096/g.23594 Transcript_10096/m.23594 type:complete len:342 (+) Transcript_10096:341-1366(+)